MANNNNNNNGNQFKCIGDCIKCSPIQRQYCSAQQTYNTMKMVEELTLRVGVLQESVDALKQDSLGRIFDVNNTPMAQEHDDMVAQEGSGAMEEIDSQDNQTTI